MSFYSQLAQLISVCKNYQKIVEDEELYFTEPYQSQYLNINKLLKFYDIQKLNIEALAAGEQTAPGMANMTPARAEYYDLEMVVPPFLAGKTKFYFYLQTYKIRCVHLLKTFSYSNFKGDWAKMRVLMTWLSAIDNEQEKHNAAGSIIQSFKDIKALGDFSKLNNKGLLQLEEEVNNIQTLLDQDPKLEEGLSADDAAILQKAAAHLKKNAHLLKDLPRPDTSFKYEEFSALETLAYRCKQLVVLVDDFSNSCEKGTKATALYEFQQELKEHFNENILVAADIHAALVKALGSRKKLSIKKLCKLLYSALEPFAEMNILTKKYGQKINSSNLEINRGLPDTIEFEKLLLITIEKEAL